MPAGPKFARLLRTATLPADWKSGRLKPMSKIILSSSLASLRAFAGSSSSKVCFGLRVDLRTADLAEVALRVGRVDLVEAAQRERVADPAELGDVEVAGNDVVREEAGAALGVDFELHADLSEAVLRDLGDLFGRVRVEEHVANHQLAAVLLAELAVEAPSERVEFLFGLLRVEGHRLAVVLIALLARDEDVVVQRHRFVDQAPLGDVRDRLPVDALGDCQPQRLVREYRPLRAVEREVIPAGAGRAPDRDALRCSAPWSIRAARRRRWRRWCCSAVPG